MYGGIYDLHVKIPQCQYIKHGLKYIAFYVKKQIAPLAVCYNFSLARDKPQGVPAFVRLVFDHDHANRASYIRSRCEMIFLVVIYGFLMS